MSTQVAKKTRPCVAQVCAFVATLITAAPVAAGQDSRPASVHLAIDQPGALREWQIESVVEQVRLIWGRVLSVPARYLSNGAAVMGWVARVEDGRLTPQYSFRSPVSRMSCPGFILLGRNSGTYLPK